MYIQQRMPLRQHAPFRGSQRGSNEGQVGTDIAPTREDEDEGERRPAAAGNLLQTLTGPQVSVALGIGILLFVLANRIATPDLVDSQARTDILGVIASGGLITNGVYLLVRVRRGGRVCGVLKKQRGCWWECLLVFCARQQHSQQAACTVRDVDSSAEYLVGWSDTLRCMEGRPIPLGCRRGRVNVRRAWAGRWWTGGV